MKLPLLLLSLSVFGGVGVAQAHDFNIQANQHSFVIKVGNHHDHKHSKDNQYSKPQNEMYCEQHSEYHHHHKNGQVTHSHEDGKHQHRHKRKRSNVYHGYGQKKYKSNDFNISYREDHPLHCWPVQKVGYWHGKKALVGGKMCRNSHGNEYVIPSSRYLINYYYH